MTNSKQKADNRLAVVLRLIEESVLSESDEQVLNDVRSLGLDPLKVKEELRFAIEAAIDRHYAARMEAAKATSQSTNLLQASFATGEDHAVDVTEILRQVLLQPSLPVACGGLDAKSILNLSAPSSGTTGSVAGPCESHQEKDRFDI